MVGDFSWDNCGGFAVVINKNSQRGNDMNNFFDKYTISIGTKLESPFILWLI